MRSLKTIIRVVLSFVLVATIISPAYAASFTLLWSDSVGTNAIALSADGHYVVVGTSGHVRFYGRGSSTPLWIYAPATGIPDFTSVAISADGSYVAAGGFAVPTGQVYFWANAKSLTGNPPPTWTSASLGGPIQHRCLAISDDGNYVAACRTASNVFYWAGATGKSGSNVATTWDYLFPSGVLSEALAMAISDDGNHVAVVGFLGNSGTEGVLGYWNNAISLTGHPQAPTWTGQEQDEEFGDVAISSDGNYVVVAGAGALGTVYYWAGATSRTGTSESDTWAGGVDVPFTSVDISCDGDSVIAGAGSLLLPTGDGALTIAQADSVTGEVYFWGGARTLTGNPVPSWTHPTSSAVRDVAINDAGTYMAAVDASIPDTVYFFDKLGTVLWQDLTIAGDKLSISCDGKTLAVGTPNVDTAYLLDTGYSSPCSCSIPPPIPEYPLGLPLLAVFMIVGYGLLRRRTRNPKSV